MGNHWAPTFCQEQDYKVRTQSRPCSQEVNPLEAAGVQEAKRHLHCLLSYFHWPTNFGLFFFFFLHSEIRACYSSFLTHFTITSHLMNPGQHMTGHSSWTCTAPENTILCSFFHSLIHSFVPFIYSPNVYCPAMTMAEWCSIKMQRPWNPIDLGVNPHSVLSVWCWAILNSLHLDFLTCKMGIKVTAGLHEVIYIKLLAQTLAHDDCSKIVI